MDRATFLEKGIRIPNLKRFMWIQTKENYERHVEKMKNQKDISEEEDHASKQRLVPLFMMNWEPCPMSCQNF